MHCETTGANPECVSLHGFRKTYTAVQDKNGVATNRVDVSQTKCLIQDQRRKHPLESGTDLLSDCYEVNGNTCAGTLSHQCIDVIANIAYDLGQEYTTALIDECYGLLEKLEDYETKISEPMVKVGYNYVNQFQWQRTSYDNLDLVLRSSYFEKDRLILHLPSYSGQEQLPQEELQLQFTFILSQGEQVISATASLMFELFQPDPYRSFKVTFSAPVTFDFGSSLVIRATKDNLDPTLATVETLTLYSQKSSCDVTTKDFENGQVLISAASVARCWWLYKSGGWAALSAQAYTSEGVKLGSVDYYNPVLLSPASNPGSCAITLVLSYADGTAINTSGSNYVITQEDLQKQSELVFTFTVPNTCGLETTQWIIRSYPDFTEERKFQDISKKNEWCSVQRLSCNNEGCLSQDGATLYPTASCSDSDDSTGTTYTICRDPNPQTVFSASSTSSSYKSHCAMKDPIHPHPRDRQEYSMCYDSSTWSKCPTYPACFNSALNFYDFLGNTLLLDFGWSMARIMSEFNLS